MGVAGVAATPPPLGETRAAKAAAVALEARRSAAAARWREKAEGSRGRPRERGEGAEREDKRSVFSDR